MRDISNKNEDTFLAKIPVRMFVWKVIVAEYGPEPIFITQKSLLGKQILNEPLDFPDGSLNISECYGEPLQVKISQRLFRHFNKYSSLFQAGFYFEKIVQTMLIMHIRAQVRAGKDAWGAMVDFFGMYDITEDEYALDAAYANWKNYKRDHPELVPKEKMAA